MRRRDRAYTIKTVQKKGTTPFFTDAAKQVLDRARADDIFQVYSADFSEFLICSSQELQHTWALDSIYLFLSCYVHFCILSTLIRFSTNWAFSYEFVGYM